MKKYTPYLLFVLVMLGFSFGAIKKVFSQTNKEENRIDKADSAKPVGTYSYVKGITPGRAKSLVGTACGLISLIIGWRAKLRSRQGTEKARTGAIVALALGLLGIVLSLVHLSTSYGAALGTGSGKAGAFVALLLGLIGMILGGLALRSKK